MNASQLHLALTHVPVILSLTGFVLLLISLLRKNQVMTRISFYFLLIAGLVTLPVYFSGEGTEEAVEHLPGVSEGIIEQHEDFATTAFIIIGLGGLVSLAGLVFYKRPQLGRIIRFTSLILAFAAAGAMVWTAHLGGQIRHTEIRTAFASAADSNGNSNEVQQPDNGNKGDDED